MWCYYGNNTLGMLLNPTHALTQIKLYSNIGILLKVAYFTNIREEIFKVYPLVIHVNLQLHFKEQKICPLTQNNAYTATLGSITKVYWIFTKQLLKAL